MKKFYLIPQPPLTQRYSLLVDDMSDKKNYGRTTDIDKIKYNQDILGKEFELEVKIKNMYSDEGITTVFPVGSFIVVLQLKKDETKGQMTFFDHVVNTSKEELRTMLLQGFSENIVDGWFQVFDALNSEDRVTSDNFDLYDLFIPNESHFDFK